MVFDVKTCFMSIAFHPKKPAVCAVGSFTGEVYILNVTHKDDNLIARSKIDDYFHREPITDLAWVFDYDERDYQVVSISGAYVQLELEMVVVVVVVLVREAVW